MVMDPMMSESEHRTAKRFIIGLFGMLFLVAGGVWMLLNFTDPHEYPVLSVKVEGNAPHVDQNVIKHVIENESRVGYFNLDVDAIREQIEQAPWVASAEVRRDVPNFGLHLFITQRKPVALWNDAAMVADDGTVFFPHQLQMENTNRDAWREFFGQLPQLSGAEGRGTASLEMYYQYSSLLQPLGLAIKSLDIDQRRAVVLQLQNGLNLKLGSLHMRERLQRFAKVYMQYIKPQLWQVAAIDLRYANGFAISYKDRLQAVIPGEE